TASIVIVDGERARPGGEIVGRRQPSGGYVLRAVVEHRPDQVAGIGAAEGLSGEQIDVGQRSDLPRGPEVDAGAIDPRNGIVGRIAGSEVAAPIAPLQILAL